MELKVYEAEGLDVSGISFVDNQPCLDMIEKVRKCYRVVRPSDALANLRCATVETVRNYVRIPLILASFLLSLPVLLLLSAITNQMKGEWDG
jgi:hypothetical protein